MNTDFTYLPSGRTAVPFNSSGRTGVGLDRILAVGGVYRPAAGSKTLSGAALDSQIGFIGARAERFMTPVFYGGVEANAGGGGGTAGYAELLGSLGGAWQLVPERFEIGGRVALGMGGGGDIPVGGGLLAKAALDCGAAPVARREPGPGGGLGEGAAGQLQRALRLARAALGHGPPAGPAAQADARGVGRRRRGLPPAQRARQGRRRTCRT